MPPAKRPDPHDKPEVPVTIRFPSDVHADATRLAEQDDRSFNQWMVRAARAAIEAEKKKGAREK